MKEKTKHLIKQVPWTEETEWFLLQGRVAHVKQIGTYLLDVTLNLFCIEYADSNNRSVFSLSYGKTLRSYLVDRFGSNASKIRLEVMS